MMQVRSAASARDAVAPDRLSTLLERHRVQATLFHSGLLCGDHAFEARPGRAFIHVLRRGRLQVRHSLRQTAAPDMDLIEPTLLFYPRGLSHRFIHPATESADYACATVEFDGGERHPIVQSLPDLIHVRLADVDGLQPALELLFAEVDQQRCGSRLLVDRLFEIVVIQLLRWIVDHPQQAGVSSGLMRGLADARLARALVALHRDPQKPWTLTQMAAVSGMSRSAFAAAFKAAMQTTPAAYLSDWRLSQAAALMRRGRPVKQIADELGFAGAASLSKAFRQRLGLSPRQWLSRRILDADAAGPL